MSVPYEKKHLTYEAQIDKLVERGLQVHDRAVAATTLSHIGYYRLTGYLHTFRLPTTGGAPGHDERQNAYAPGSTFEQAVALWAFDRDLRMLLLDGLEQFEITLRTSLAYRAGAVDPFIHHKPELLTTEFTAQPATTSSDRMSQYDRWLVKYLERVESAKNEAFVQWFEHKYDGRLPIWTAIEILEFGQTSRLIKGLPIAQRRQIASDFGVSSPRDFGSWVAALNGVRNVCAHHSRLWNRSLTATPARPNESQIPELGHLRSLDDVARVKVYGPIAILAWLLTDTDEGTTWRRSMIDLLKRFPEIPQGSLQSSGFPSNWAKLDLWS